MAEGPARTLRVLDMGIVSALRSQCLWHGIASGMRPGDPPALSFCRPATPYVSIGFHRAIEEIDLDVVRSACGENTRRLQLLAEQFPHKG